MERRGFCGMLAWAGLGCRSALASEPEVSVARAPRIVGHPVFAEGVAGLSTTTASVSVYVPTTDCRVVLFYGNWDAARGACTAKWDGTTIVASGVAGATGPTAYANGRFSGIQVASPGAVGYHTASIYLTTNGPDVLAWVLTVVLTESATLSMSGSSAGSLDVAHPSYTPGTTDRLLYCLWNVTAGTTVGSLTFANLTDVEEVWSLTVPPTVGGTFRLYTGVGSGNAVTVTSTTSDAVQYGVAYAKAPFGTSSLYPLTGE